jgi:subtilase family serine protease
VIIYDYLTVQFIELQECANFNETDIVYVNPTGTSLDVPIHVIEMTGLLSAKNLSIETNSTDITGLPNTFDLAPGSIREFILTINLSMDNKIHYLDLVKDGWIFDTIRVHIVYKADLTISSTNITFSNDEPMEGDIVTISAAIDNVGMTSAKDILVEFYVNGTLINDTTIPSLNANQSASVSTQFAFSEGNNTIAIDVNRANAIYEYNPMNNNASRVLVVGPALPDISVESISFDNTEPIDGDSVKITTTISNSGRLDVPTLNVRFYDGTTLIYETIISINASETSNVLCDWIVTNGSHVAKVIIDEENMIVESNEQNNYLTALLDVLSRPDITIESIALSNINPYDGEQVEIISRIRNQGIAGVFEISVRIYDNSSIIDEKTLSLGPNAYADIITKMTITTGIHNIKVIGDEFDFINEFNETNNELSVHIIVSQLDFSIEGIVFSDSNPVEGDIVDIIVNIYNNGSVNAEGLSVKLYDHGTLLDERIISIGSESRINVTFKWIASSGKHNFKIVLNELGEIKESVWSNNEDVREISVSQSKEYPIADFMLYFGLIITLVITVGLILFLQRRYYHKKSSRKPIEGENKPKSKNGRNNNETTNKET